MRKFLLKNLCIIISAITACFIFAPFLYFIIGKIEPATDLIAAIIAVLIGIISISFPIIIGNTAQRLAAYNNKYIASIFREEATYKRMLHIIPILSGIIIAFFFFSYKTNSHDSIIVSRIIAAFAVGLCVYALIVFRKFWDVFSEYNINTDSLVLGKIAAKVRALQEQQKPSAEYLDYMDIYYQILYTKLKAESYINLINIQKKQSELILGVFDNISENGDNYELFTTLQQFFEKYYLSAYLCWRKSFRENADAAGDALNEYYRVLNEIFPRVISIPAIFYQPLFFLYHRIAGDLTIRDARSIPHCRVAPWQWYMNMLSSGILPIKTLYSLDQQILAVMAIVIQNGNQAIFKSFIANTMDGIWLIKKFEPNISDKKVQLIMSDIENKLSCVFSLSEIDDIEKIIVENTQDESLKQDLKQYIQGHYKYNHVRLVVIILGAYCLFKKRYDYIEYLLNYNQPKNSIARFLNPDIIPYDLNILLKLYAQALDFEGIFHHIWEDHNDGQYWFKQFISLLICKLADKKRSKTHYDHDRQDNKQRLEYYKYCIDEMQQYLTDFDTNIIVACGITDIHLDDIKNTLSTFSQEIQDQIGRITKTYHLSEEKTEKFKGNVLQLINSSSIWANILTKNVNTDASITLSRSVGYNTLIEKSFLAEGDTGIYAGFERSFAKMIVYQIDFFIEHSLRFRASTKDWITKSNFKDKIFELDDSWIVLFVNYRNMIEWLWNKPGFQWGRNQSHLVGTTNKGTLIYSTADPADRSARVFIFKKDCISKIVGIAEMNIEVTDLFQNEELIRKILDTKPQWLENYNTDEEKRDAIQKNVQIKISGEVSFSTVRNLDIYIFDNI